MVSLTTDPMLGRMNQIASVHFHNCRFPPQHLLKFQLPADFQIGAYLGIPVSRITRFLDICLRDEILGFSLLLWSPASPGASVRLGLWLSSVSHVILGRNT